MQPVDPDRPWWTVQQKPQHNRMSLGATVVIAVVAGLIGSLLGGSSNLGSLIHQNAKLVSTSSTIGSA